MKQKFVSLLRQAAPDLMLCGHLHEYIHHKATADTPFPVIVNSNSAVLKITADANRMEVVAVDTEGKQVDRFTINKR